MIIGQIHGADDLISVAFVMLHYTGGAVHVVVKHEHEGDESTDLPLLTGVPLGAPFDFTMRDNGNGSLTFAANHGSQQRDRGHPAPAGLRRCHRALPVRCLPAGQLGLRPARPMGPGSPSPPWPRRPARWSRCPDRAQPTGQVCTGSLLCMCSA